jgi:hypothetical protein
MLCAAFFGLTQTAYGFRINFFAPFTRSSSGEVYFWLAHALLLFPGACLIGYAVSGRLGSALERLSVSIETLKPSERRLGLLALFLLSAALARIGRFAFLRDFPLTDDEYAARFGGQVLALGKIAVAAFQPVEALPERFLFLRNGMLTSFDWPGIQFAWALAEWTHAGSWVFALIAAIPLVAIAILIGKRLGPVWGVIAAGFLFVSPMSFALSMSSHAHLLSRAMIALALLFYMFGRNEHPSAYRYLAGLCAGFSFLSRPLESAFFFLVPALCLVWRVLRRELAASRTLMLVFLGAIGPVAIFALHNWLVTGQVWLPARFAPNPIWALEGWRRPLEVLKLDVFWNRFGANVSYNLFMLAIWFLGPVGIALVIAGVMRNSLTRVLGLSVVSVLGLALFHDNYGLHEVGPIHYSEMVVPLAVIAVHGLHSLIGWAESRALPKRVIASALAAACVLGLGTFDLWHSFALRRQSRIQAEIYGFIDGAELGPAIVLAPKFDEVWFNAGPDFKTIGTFVFEWRRPRPDWSDEVLILRDRVDPAVLRNRFPERRLFRLKPAPTPPYLALTPIPTTRSETD